MPRLPILFALALVVAAGSLRAQDAPFQTAEPAMTPYKREVYFYGMRSYPFGRIPQNARTEALYQAQHGLAPFSTSRGVLSSTNTWRQIGPSNIGGRIRSVVCHPADGNTVWAGAADGGVWKSTDRGGHWKPIMDFENAISMGALAVDPHNPNILYAGTGEMSTNVDAYNGAGIFKTVDGGVTWRPIGLSTVGAFARIVVHPLNSLLVFAGGTKNGSGFYRSTDGGNTWTRTFTEPVSDITADPNDAGRVWIGTMSKGIFRSDDSGKTFTGKNNGVGAGTTLGRISVQCAPSQPSTLYALSHETDLDTDRTRARIYRSTDAGNEWQRVYDGAGGRNFLDNTGNTQGWYNNVIAVMPNDPAIVIAGGVSMVYSLDTGAHWNYASIGHSDQHAAAFDPSHPQTLYVGNDGGMYRSDSTSMSFEHVSSGLEVSQFYAMAVDQSDPVKTYGGTQDNGVVSTTSTFAGDLIRGDGFFVALDYTNPDILYAVWTDGSISRLRISIHDEQIVMDGIDFDDEPAWSAPLVMDPKSPLKLWHGRHAIYGTVDGAAKWIPTTMRFQGHATAIGISPVNTDMVYAGSDRGEIAVTRSGGADWDVRTFAPGVPNRAVTDFAASHVDSGTAYMSVSGFYTGHVFRTTDYGASWHDISGGLPDIPINALALHPDDERIIYAGSDIGMFITTDGGATWATYNQGLPRVVVADLEVHRSRRTLRMASHGRSMWEIDLEKPEPSAQIVSPSGGEVWLGGTQHAVTWTGIAGAVRIDLSLDGGIVWHNLAPSVTALRWTVSDTVSFLARVRVVSLADTSRSAVSRTFSIERFHPGGILQAGQFPGIPYGLAFDGNVLWATDFESNRLTKLDPNTLAFIDTVAMQHAAGDSLFTDIAIHPVTGHFFIHRILSSTESQPGGLLVEVDTNGTLIRQWLSRCDYPIGLAFVRTADGEVLMASDRDGSEPTYMLDPNDPTQLVRVVPRARRVYAGPRGAANGARPGEIYQVITDFAGDALQSAVAERMTADDQALTCSFALASAATSGTINARGIEFDPRDSSVWVSDYVGSIYKMISCDNRPPNTTAVDRGPAVAEAGATLSQNEPNPAGTATAIAFTLAHAADARVDVYDAAGARVGTPADGHYEAGPHKLSIDLSTYAAGVYRYVLLVNGQTAAARTMVCVR